MSDQRSGWSATTLHDLVGPAGLIADGDWIESKDQDPQGDIRLLQLADIGDGRFLNRSNRFINADKFVELRCTEILEGDVLIARMPAPLGRACIVPNLAQRCITVVDVALVRPVQDAVSRKWLMHFINAPETRESIESLASGTTRSRISRKNLAEIVVPVPPRREQDRISTRLDALLTRLDACAQRLSNAVVLVNRLRTAVIDCAIEGELTKDWRSAQLRPTEWQLCRLADLTKKVGSGSTPTGGEAAYQTHGVPLIRSMNVVFYGFKRQGLAFLNAEQAHQLRGAEVRHRDVLLNITGASIGRVTTVPADLDGARVNQHVCAIRPTTAVLPEYLCSFLACSKQQRVIGSENYGATRQALTKQQILNFEVPLPTMEEQTEIVTRVETMSASIATLELRITAAGALMGRLTPALRSKALRGELVPQDPDDEPAITLLQEIRESGAAAPAKDERGQRPHPERRLKPVAKKLSEIPTDYLLNALRAGGGRLAPEALLNLSDLTIDDFYTQLKSEMHTITDVRPDENTRLLEAAQ